MSHSDPRRAFGPVERPLLLALALLACALQLGALGSKGLSYDEAATALMARATPRAIVEFHWLAAFEHPPFWQLLMAGWGRLAGQSEFALRFLPALAATLLVPLCAALGRRLWGQERAAALIGGGLVAVSPAILLYGQEARMYTLVVALAVVLIALALRLVEAPALSRALVFVLLAWAMTGLHYYSALVPALLALFGMVEWLRSRRGAWLVFAALLGLLPLAVWMAFSPGFHGTLRTILSSDDARPGIAAFTDGLWRDLAFGSVRWQPAQSVAAYLLLPVALWGLALSFRRGRSGWWLPALVLAPLLGGIAAFGALATRYILFVLPLILLAAALAIVWFWRRHWLWGAGAALLALAPAFAGLAYYENDYAKSDYRTMAAALKAQAGAGDLALLEGPRQHLLWKYYGPPGLGYQPVPLVDLPEYWPVNAGPVVPEETDGQIQDALRDHAVLWLVLTAEDEVDAGEFVSKYMRAVAYLDRCDAWLDVRLCRFRSPASVALQPLPLAAPVALGDGLWLDAAAFGPAVVDADGTRRLPVRLSWRVDAAPTVDRKASLRLEAAGGTLLAQVDDRPIGPLLPLPTWNPGDEKPGYFVLEIPAGVTADSALLRLHMYDDAGASAARDLELGTLPLHP